MMQGTLADFSRMYEQLKIMWIQKKKIDREQLRSRMPEWVIMTSVPSLIRS